MEYFIKHQQFDEEWEKHKVGEMRIIRAYTMRITLQEVFRFDWMRKIQTAPLWMIIMLIGLGMDRLVYIALKWLLTAFWKLW